MTSIRWGILGVEADLNRIADAIHQSYNGELVAIANRALDQIPKTSTLLYGIRTYKRYEDLLAASDIDAVYIAAPPYRHVEWSIKAAEAGKHVLCEKPLALDTSDAREMIDVSKKQGLHLAEAAPYRFHPQRQKVKQLISDGAIGQLRILRASFTYWLPPDQRETDYRMQKETGGGSLRDVGWYCIDLMRYLTDDEPDITEGIPQWASNEPSARAGRKTIDLNLVGMIKFPSGIIGHFDCGFAAAPENSYEIRGDKGRILVERGFLSEPDEQKTIHLWRGDQHEEIIIPPVNDYLLMVEDFAASLLTEQPPTFDPAVSVHNIRHIGNIYNVAYMYTQEEVLRATGIGWNFKISIEQEGRDIGQGIGYLPDGTLVVIERGKHHIGEEVEVRVDKALLTSIGYMILARIIDDDD